MKDPRQQASRFVDQLRAIFGERLRSAILYGSVARGESIPGISNINVMVLFDQLDARTLAAASPIARKWLAESGVPALIMELAQWRRAADVFAIELADMRDAHVPLSGEDVVAGEPVRLPELRAQAERELRGKLLQLQTGILMDAENGNSLGGLLQAALPSFATYLRAVIRLGGRQPPAATAEVIRDGMALVGAAPDAFLEVWERRSHRRSLRADISDPIVDAYHTAAEQIAVYVDTLGR